MKKRIISIICAISVCLSSFVFSASAAEDTTIFEDTLENLDSVSETIGDWQCLAHQEMNGLTVAGRKDHNTVCSLIYNFKNQAVTSLAVDLVVYSGFYTADNYELSVLAGSSWTALETEVSDETDIPNASAQAFKKLRLTSKNIPEGAVSVKVTLNGNLNYVLWIDNVCAELTDYTGGQDEGQTDIQYTDECDSLNNSSYTEGNWQPWTPRSEFGKNVLENTAGTEGSSIYYTFKDGEIAKINIELVIYSGFFQSSECVLSVREKNNSVWSNIPYSTLAETDIEGYEDSAFKSLTLKADTIPSGMTQLKIQFKNAVSYTMFLDKVQVVGCSVLGERENTEVYNENLYFFTDSDGTALSYYLVTPNDYDKKKQYPLVLYMHGIGGDTDISGYEHLRDQLFKNKNYDCILLAPLADWYGGQAWLDYAILNNAPTSGIYLQDNYLETPAFTAAYDLLQKIKDEYGADSSRIYGVGVSMGGFAIWDMATRYPDLFAAAVPICGGADYTKAEKIACLPIWTFHGTADETVIPDGTRAMVKALEEKGSTAIKYTEYEGYDHGIWFQVMDNEPELYPWMFAQTRAPQEDPSDDEDNRFVYFVDELTSLDKTASYEGNWDCFPQSDAFGGISIAGRQNTDSQNNLFYTADDGNIQSVEVKLAYLSGYVDPAASIAVAVRASDDDDWTDLALDFGSPEDISGAANDGYTRKSLTVSAEQIPDGATQVRISLINDVAWTIFLDSITLKISSSDVYAVGDLNNDGRVDILDLISFKKALAATQTLSDAYDLNGDAVVNSGDMLLLKKSLLEIAVLDSAKVLAMKRDVVYYRTAADAELEWIASTQLANGAIPQSAADSAGNATVNPYFSDYAAMALLERPQLYKDNVKKYINWHFGKLNEDGTIYDYSYAYGKETTEGHCDSTDSYAATFLSLLWKYYDKTGDSSLIMNHTSDIEKVISALNSTMNNNLTFAKASYEVKYTMDNCEVFEGLSAAADIYGRVLSDSATATQMSKSAEMVAAAIERNLWNSNGYYEIGIFADGNAVQEFNWSEYYPSAMAQIFPIFTGVISRDSSRAADIYASFKDCYSFSNVESEAYSFAALTAAVMGDNDALKSYMKAYKDVPGQIRYTAYTGMAVMAAEIMQQNLLAKIG